MKTVNRKPGTSLTKTAALGLLLTLFAISAPAQPTPAPSPPRRLPPSPGMPGPSTSTPELTNAPSNYLVRVEWKDTHGPTGVIEVLTAEGQFQVSSSFPGSVAGEPAPSTPVSLNGTLKALSAEQGHFQLFLGRTVSENVGGFGQKSPSIQQRQEGLTVTFFVTFGKPVVARKDANGEVSGPGPKASPVKREGKILAELQGAKLEAQRQFTMVRRR